MHSHCAREERTLLQKHKRHLHLLTLRPMRRGQCNGYPPHRRTDLLLSGPVHLCLTEKRGETNSFQRHAGKINKEKRWPQFAAAQEKSQPDGRKKRGSFFDGGNGWYTSFGEPNDLTKALSVKENPRQAQDGAPPDASTGDPHKATGALGLQEQTERDRGSNPRHTGRSYTAPIKQE